MKMASAMSLKCRAVVMLKRVTSIHSHLEMTDRVCFLLPDTIALETAFLTQMEMVSAIKMKSPAAKTVLRAITIPQPQMRVIAIILNQAMIAPAYA